MSQEIKNKQQVPDSSVISADYEELDLSKPEDLNVFVEAVEDSYVDAKEKSGASGTEDVLKELEHNLVEIQDMVINCHDNLCSNLEAVSDETIDQLQKLYNNILSIRDQASLDENITEPDSNQADTPAENKQPEDFQASGFLPEENRSKKMSINDFDSEQKIEIKVANKAVETIDEDMPENIKVVEHKTLEGNEARAIGVVEKTDVLNQVVVAGGEKIPLAERPVDKESLTGKYLQQKHYQSFLRKVGLTPKDFEKKLIAEINLIEASGTDNLEKWLGVKHKSPFEYLQDMKLSEIEEFVSGPNTRKMVMAKGVKYETFLIWIDLIPEMVDMVGENQQMAFGELFARWFAELAMSQTLN